MVKWKSFIKGALWELIGAIVIFIATFFITGSVNYSTVTSIGWPVFRALTWYPYEKTFKRFWRWFEERVSDDV